ncbi:MAG: ATPase [Acidobacteriaceae bacterium]
MRILLSWSSGKDCAWALHELRQSGDHDVVGLLTTINSEYDRVAMHGMRSSLLRAQAEAARLPLWTLPLPWPCSNEHYESAMCRAIERAKSEHVEAIAFGDLFLIDIRAYREEQFAETGIQPMFPLWGRDTAALARTMISGGLKAKLVCIDPRRLPPSFAGRDFDEALLAELPKDVDPCGENGEFHTAVYEGPMFVHKVQVRAGEVVARSGFLYSDLIPTSVCEQPILQTTSASFTRNE